MEFLNPLLEISGWDSLRCYSIGELQLGNN